MEDEIFNMALKLGGDGCDEEVLRSLCQTARVQLEGELREGLSPDDCGTAFVLAAAWLALAGLCAGEAGVERFTAGQITIQRGDGPARQAALRLQARQVMHPYLNDEGFSFQGVPG